MLKVLLLSLVSLLCLDLASSFNGLGHARLKMPPVKQTRLLTAVDAGADAFTTDSDIKTFASYVFYKGKAAMSVKLIPPTFTSMGPKSRTVSRTGALFLEFAPVGAAPREYDWSRKATFSLSPTECGEMLAASKDKGVEFFHDPNVGEVDAGKVTKRLKLTPAPDGKTMFLGINIQDKFAPTPLQYSIPITLGELASLQAVMHYAVPRLLGFDAVWGESPTAGGAPPPAPPPAPEWA